MHDLEQTNETKSMMKGNYNDHRLDKEAELNDSMTINQSSRDEYEQKIHSLGGNE